MSNPVIFEYRAEVFFTPEELCEHVLDLGRWTSFEGYGPLPAIVSARFYRETKEVEGTIIAITCADGSSHFEEIIKWCPPHDFTLKLHNFSPPLSKLATHFDEKWSLHRADSATRVTRRFEMYPTHALFRPAVWAISRLMRGAVAHQMRTMTEESRQDILLAETLPEAPGQPRVHR